MAIGKNILGALIVMISMIISVVMVSALPITIDSVKLDSDEIYTTGDNTIRAFDRGDDSISVKVEVTSQQDLEDVQIEALMRGYDHSDLIEDTTEVFDMKAGTTYVKKMTLKFPTRMDKDQYKLRIRVADRDGETTEQTYEIEIDAQRHAMLIQDVIFSPSNEVISGRALLTMVRMKNVGSVDSTDGIKVSINVPALGITATDYVDEVEEDDSVTSEELYLRVPACTKGGLYDATITVSYHDGEYSETTKKQIRIVEDESCNVKPATNGGDDQPKTILTVGPTSQDVVAGEGGVVYPLTITNLDNVAKTYVITADGYADWATIKVSPANIVVLQSGESKAVYVYITANENAAVGEHMFAVTVSSGGQVIRDFTLKSNVVESEKKSSFGELGTIKNVLLIGLLILVVLLVILGLIIGFSKLRKSEDEEEDDSETYY